jgi:hypothetical protein
MFLMSRFVLKSAITALLLAAGSSATRADTIEILPSASATCDEQWIVAAKQLKAGDELILHERTYSQPCRRAIQINGFPGNPIIIRTAANARPIITRPAEANTKQNNLEIADSSVTGITVAPHAANPRTRNVSIVNNTIYGPMGEAVNASGLNDGGMKIRANFVEGPVVGVKFRPGQFLVGGNHSSTFANPAELNFWPRPQSALIGAPNVSLAPPLDFNNMKRGRTTTDVGAYDTQKRAGNPGWKIVPGFKSPKAVVDDGKNSSAELF